MLGFEGDSSHSLFTQCWSCVYPGLAACEVGCGSWIFERVLKCFWCEQCLAEDCAAMWGWALFCPAGCLGGNSRWEGKVSEKGGCEWREGGDGAEEGGSEKNQG